MRKAASKRPKAAGRRPKTRAALNKLLRRRFVQVRPWRYIAICVVGGEATPDSAKVMRHDYIFWVNWDQRNYTVTFRAENPVEGQPPSIPLPSVDADGNFGVAGPYRVRTDTSKNKHQYDITAVNWSGPPDPPDVNVGG